MCTSGQIIGSLLLLSVLEIGLGASSVAVGAVSFSLALREHQPQLGDSSPCPKYTKDNTDITKRNTMQDSVSEDAEFVTPNGKWRKDSLMASVFSSLRPVNRYR
ncbi:hypothetical protein G4228_012057 [Cervus hanglu yarkandensis]|nr:hypothetical protein G4228_012057 [Cervus hanglu yarkandensis]